MKAITRTYLTEFIFRLISKTINLHRRSNGNNMPGEMSLTDDATEDEVLDFIQAIPYFDLKLKDFIIGNFPENVIIISQAWENEFIIKCNAWAESYEWLYGDDRFLKDIHLEKIRRELALLGLPY